MLSLNPEKLLVVLVVALVLLGPDKLPRVARQLGAGWRHLKEFQQRIEREVRESMPDLPPSHEIARMARSPARFLNSLAKLPEEDALVPDPAAPAVPRVSENLEAGGELGGTPDPRTAGTPPFVVPEDPSMN